MFRRIAGAVALLGLSLTAAQADFQRWSSEVVDNPFSGGTDVSLLYILSMRTQVQVRCDSSEQGVELVAIPGFEYTADMVIYTPTVKLAVDGDIILDDVEGKVSAFGANQAGVRVLLDREQAEKLTAAFVTAQRQIAIEDGISDKPFLMTASGSTAAAKNLRQCYEAQEGTVPAPAEGDEIQSADSGSDEVVLTDEDLVKSDFAIKAEIRQLEGRIEALKAQLDENDE